MRLHLCRHTFASLWGDCLRFASLWRANSRGDSSVLGVHFSNVFRGLLFVFATRTYLKNFLKVYNRCVFIESFKIVFWKCVRLLVHASMKPRCLARRPLCHKVNLPSCVGRQPLCHKVNLLRCEARRPLCHKVNLQRCEARRRYLIMTCDIFGTGQTNIFALCYLFGKTYKPAYSSATLKSLKSTHSIKLLKKLLTWAHTFHWRLWWFRWNVWEV